MRAKSLVVSSLNLNLLHTILHFCKSSKFRNLAERESSHNAGLFCLYWARRSLRPFEKYGGRYSLPLICHLPHGNKRAESRVNSVPVLQHT